MGHVYTILPDGTVFMLNDVDDYALAAHICQDEAGDLLQDSAGDMAGPALASLSCDD